MLKISSVGPGTSSPVGPGTTGSVLPGHLTYYCHTWPQLITQLDPASAGQLGPPLALFSPTRPAGRLSGRPSHAKL